MGWSIFIEEPGINQLSLPYGVLAGLAIEDILVWQLVRKLKDAEMQFFGSRIEHVRPSLTIENILAPEVLRLAGLAQSLEVFSNSNSGDLTLNDDSVDCSEVAQVSLAQSKVSYCKFVLELLRDFQARAFAIIIPIDDVLLSYDIHLRKDYAFLFERISIFLEEQNTNTIGTMILDSSRHSGKYVSIQSMTEYFEKTTKGRMRARYLIPEPVLSNSSLSTVNQAAELFSYIIASGFRLPGMSKPRRNDLDSYVKQCNGMRFSYISDKGSRDWSFKYLESVRANREAASPTFRV